MLIKIAWRSIWRNKRRTLITVCSIGLGLTFSIFFISLGAGVYARMVDQATRMQAGHITLEHTEYRDAPSIDLVIAPDAGVSEKIKKLKYVEMTKFIVMGQGIAKSGAGNVPAGIMGVEPSVEMITSPLAKNIIEGRYLSDEDKAAAVIGSEMADRLNLKVGKKMVLSSNDVNGDLVEVLCRVKGIFKTGSEEMDAYFIQTPINFTRRLYNMPPDAATQMGVILKDADDQSRAMHLIKKQIEGLPLAVVGWQEVMPDVYAYIKIDMGSNYVFQGMLIFLILFTIFNTILMSVLERQREFAVLLSLGTKPGQLMTQLFFESLFLGLVGCGLGVLFGGTAAYLGHAIGIDISSFLNEGVSISGFAISSTLRTKLSAGIIFGTALIVLCATMVLSLFPMRRAVRVNIVDMLR